MRNSSLAVLPPELRLERASFYSGTSSIRNVSKGTRAGYEFVAFDYCFPDVETYSTETIIAIKIGSPQSPATNLSRTSGLQLERVGEWILAFEHRRAINSVGLDNFVNEVVNLIEYAKVFPQNQ